MSASSATPNGSAPPTECVVRAESLSKHFGEVRALDDFSLCIRKGETFGLLGPNGAGKTTFIRAVAGILKTSGGSLTVLGEQMPRYADRVRRRVGYMTQLQALYNDLSVWENIQFFGRVWGLSDKKERDARCEHVLDLVELLPRRSSITANLSGGMRQRLSLACALVHDPELLLLDEPTVGVDPQLRQTFWGYFRTLNERGVTIIVSSHVMDEADRCDRLGLIRFGRLLASGSPADIRAMAGTDDLEVAFLALAGHEHATEEEAIA
ncbi:MAG TPA: ABC transporter ATP-binding protein [Chloroflexia bacterium]|nr:ABC transporter ATP-binding protein [Chloroflexia bacterium]